MKVYELADTGLQLWTFAERRKRRTFLLWDYAAWKGYKVMTRREAASFLQSFRRQLKVMLDQ